MRLVPDNITQRGKANLANRRPLATITTQSETTGATV